MKQKVERSTSVKKPEAHIAINKNRIKEYEKRSYQPKVYLEDGQEFQFELFNPKTDDVLAKIELDGEPISDKGVVLRPGERVFLDRFLDTRKKFKFDTYEIPNEEEAKEAASFNGEVKVTFFDRDRITELDEKERFFNDLKRWFDTSSTPLPQPWETGPTWIRNASDSDGHVGEPASSGFYSTNAVNTSITNSMSAKIKASASNETRSASIETGRVEEGDTSSQQFQTVDKRFNSFPTASYFYKILPVSQKEVTTEDFNAVKKYCAMCGAKKKPKYNFCPYCGAEQ